VRGRDDWDWACLFLLLVPLLSLYRLQESEAREADADENAAEQAAYETSPLREIEDVKPGMLVAVSALTHPAYSQPLMLSVPSLSALCTYTGLSRKGPGPSYLRLG